MVDIRIFTILIVFVCFKTELVLSKAAVNYHCSDDRHPYLNAGTKTPYYFVHGLIKNTSVPNCEPVQIWMLTRHGTRNPGNDEIEDMMNLLPELRQNIIQNYEKRGSNLCRKDIEHLKKWKVDPTLNKGRAKYLTKQGEEDLISLGKRYKEYLPELFQADSDVIKSDRYNFRSTDTQRTILSMASFIHGGFGNVSMDMEVVPAKEDTLLKVYKACRDWRSKHNSSKTDESSKFIAGPEYKKMIHDVSRRLGFASDLSLDAVTIMYKACTFERAWHVHKVSPWCAVFTEDELKVFEYEEDLYYYGHFSYGNKGIKKIACRTLQDMFNHFAELEKGDSNGEPKGVFYYTHSSMVQLHLMSMGIAEDSTQLTASNFETMRDKRKWRTSHLVPFAANFAAVFYRCDSSNKVKFYLNEKPVDYEGCDEGACDWEYLKKRLGSTAFNCNVGFCRQ